MDTKIMELLEACYGEELSLLRGNLGALEDRITILIRQWGQGLLQRVVLKHPLGYQGTGRACSCRGWQRFVSYRVKTIHTTVGWIDIQRAYYHCSACGTGTYPYDQASGLGSEAVRAGLAKACCTLAIGSSFAESSRRIEELFGQQVASKTIERIVHHVGAVTADQHRQTLEAFRQDRHIPACDRPPKRLYIAPDGTTIHERDGWHESKIGCLRWDDEHQVPHQYYVGDSRIARSLANTCGGRPTQGLGHDLEPGWLVGDIGFADLLAQSRMGSTLAAEAPGSLKIYLQM